MENNRENKKKEPLPLAITKAIGLVLCLWGFYEFGLLVGIVIGLIDFVIIVLLEATIFSEDGLVKHVYMTNLMTILIKLGFVGAVIVVGVLFYRSLFQGFVALIALLILVYFINKD
jgi:hypothetical protein